jgi:hypothetical protein
LFFISIQVCLFIRRLGYKEYVPDLIKYHVDGRTLLLLDTGDYPSINITTRLHIRKIQVEIDKRYPPWLREDITSIHLIRREKLRRQGELEAAAIEIQRVYRGHLGRIDAKNVLEVKRVLALKKNYDQGAERGKKWWLERINTPAPNPLALPLNRKGNGTFPVLSLSSAVPTHSRPNTGHRPTTGAPLDLHDAIGGIPPLPGSYPLPPLKLFGKKRTYLSTKGWGGYVTQSGKDVWSPLEFTPVQPDQTQPREKDSSYRDIHITTLYTEKLARTGYDRKREEIRLKDRVLRFKVKPKGGEKKKDPLAIL